MKLQTMLLVIAAAWLAAVPSRGFTQDLGPITPEFAAWQAGSLVTDLGVDNPALLNPAEDIYCDDGCCGCCSGCLKQKAIFGSLEGLMWWGKGSHLPPLVTTSPPGTPQANAGVLGLPTTTVLFGDEMGGEEMQIGARATFGLWLDPEHNVSWGTRFYTLGGDKDQFFAESDGNPILARPFFNTQILQDDALLIAFPNIVEGNVAVDYRANNFMGAESYLAIMMHRETRRRVDFLIGYHFLRMDDQLIVNSFQRVTEIGGVLPQGTTFTLSDQFSTENEFHGGTVGFKGRMARGNWSLDGVLKTSIGNQRQQVTINGAGEVFVPPGPAAPLNGGFLALPTNIGVFERNRFMFIPETSLNLTYHHTPCLSFHAGYNLIWMTEAVTSGDQVDLVINLSQQAGPLVGDPRPAFPFRERDFWVQGINLGMNLDF